MVVHDLVIRAETVYTSGTPRSAAVVVDGGRITALPSVDEPVSAREEVVLAADEVLIPGVVDSHVHVNEPGRTAWEGFASATAAAAAGGVTTIIDMPLNSIPPTTTPEALEAKRASAEGRCLVDVGFWAGAVPENLDDLKELQDAGVFGFKAFLSPSGVPEFGHLNHAELMKAAARIAEFDGLLIVHAEDPGVLDAAAPDGTGVTDGGYDAFLASRPDEAETVAIGRVIEAVRRSGVRAHILHLSSAKALDALAAARADGLPITVETCPHYLCFTPQDITAGATQFKCCPPIRSAANRDALWQGLADGVIDTIASDHSPATAELKFAGGGDFRQAWGGISGLQVALTGVWAAAAERGLPLEKVLGWMCRATADLAGLPDRGRIEPGARADLVAFAPAPTVRVSAERLLHRNPVSAFDGAHVRGVVRRTWLAGQVVTSPCEDPPGRLLSRA